jgi:hypothetical protein
MLFILLSIICSITVGVLFKISRKYSISTTQIVMWNYVVALLLCYLTFSPDLKSVTSLAPWNIYLPLGILLPLIFVFLAASIRHMGIVKTDAAQRLSLFIPIIASLLIFREEFNNLKILGLLVGFPALLLILSKESKNTNNKWIYPAIVLIGFGIIDILFKQIALFTNLPYTTSLFVVFCISFIIMITTVVYKVALKKERLSVVNLIFGCLVGVFNFGNILFYLKAHKAFSENPSTVFAAMNIGVIILGSLVGILAFKEKLTLINYIGLFLALTAIVLIVLSQIYI